MTFSACSGHWITSPLPSLKKAIESLSSLTLTVCAETFVDVLNDANHIDKLGCLHQEIGLTDHDEILLSEVFSRFDCKFLYCLDRASCSQIVTYLLYDMIASCIATFCEKIRKSDHRSAPDMMLFFLNVEAHFEFRMSKFSHPALTVSSLLRCHIFSYC